MRMQRAKLTSIILVATSFLSMGVNAETATNKIEAAKSQPHAVHWTYNGKEGPAEWGHLDGAYKACSIGKQQSPINLAEANAKDLSDISFHYQPSALRVLNNGHTVQANYDKGSYIEVDGKRYDVVQFHYHTPSEHAVDGKLFDGEFHIVHKSAEGKLAVVGILLEKGKNNKAYQPFLSHLPAEESPEQDAGIKLNAADLLPKEQTTYRYSGSLTTPPCTEGVSWLVMKTPVQLSKTQLNTLSKLFDHNNRPVQPLNARPLLGDTQ
jgi:carbonic anhydrase